MFIYPYIYPYFVSLSALFLMLFQCFVCNKSFTRAQHRSSHIRLKKDDAHQLYLATQRQNILDQISTTVEAATSAAANASASVPDHVAIQEYDVDVDDLPSSFNMDVDSLSEVYSDSEQGMISGPELTLSEGEDNEMSQPLAGPMNGTGVGLDNDDLEDIEDILAQTFDFLPDPELDNLEGKDAIESSVTSSKHARRTLVDIEGEQPTYRWHQNAGKVYGQEPTMHARWQALFGAIGPDIQPYQPFHSRLDWEIAQWAVKEKISQKSFNRLLIIPQVKYVLLLAL